MSSPKSLNPIRVASVPYSQVYIRHLEPWDELTPKRMFRLPDPTPAGGSQSAQSSWWPPRMLTAEWIREHHQEFDLMHIHFGFDAVTPNQLYGAISELKRHGKPLVYTVHDLINPHQPDPAAHRALLDVLIPAADKLITLTQGAAAEIEAIWGWRAQVLPHPHVVDFATMDRLRAMRVDSLHSNQPRRIGVHFKGLRANMSAAILKPLSDIVAGLDNAVLQVNIHRQVLDPSNREYQPELARQLFTGQMRGQWVLEAHDYFSETELFEYFASLDINVLPYKFGTHSGWLEAALDTGAKVVAPTCGHYADQNPTITTYRWSGETVDEATLQSAIETQLSNPEMVGMDSTGRQQERALLAQAHQSLYEELLVRSGSWNIRKAPSRDDRLWPDKAWMSPVKRSHE